MSLDVDQQITTLPNGIRILSIEVPGDLFYLQWGVLAGTEHEHDSHEIEAFHLLEHMNGGFTSSKYPSEKEALRMMSLMGVQSNARTTEMETSYYASGLRQYAEKIIDVLLLSYIDFHLDRETFNGERSSVVEEIEGEIDSTFQDFNEYVNRTIFAGTSRAITSVERLKSTSSLTPEDLLRIRDKYYTSNQTFVIISCRDVKKFVPLIMEYLLDVPLSKSLPPVILLSRPPGPMIRTMEVKSDQGKIVLCIPVNHTYFDWERYPITRLANIFAGGGFSSRLMNILRLEMGLIYRVEFDLEFHPLDPSMSMLSIEIRALSHDLDTVLKTLIKEIRSIQEEGITDEEYKLSLSQIQTSASEMSLIHTPERYVDNYRNAFIWRDSFDSNEEDLNEMQRLTKEELSDQARILFAQENIYIFIAS